MPPKRMSDILQPSSTDARISSPLPTAGTNTSDRPTLPIIGATSERGATKGTKRKRTASSNEPAASKKPIKVQMNTNHPALYTPWLLLPAKQRKDVEGRKKGVQVIVYSRNQNVKSGIGGLLRVVGAASGASKDQAGKDQAEPEQNVESGHVDEEDKMVVVSAQGEGTVKLVGIADMVRRIVGEERKENVAVGKDGKKEGSRWYIYTVLSNVEVPRMGEATSEEQDGEEGNSAEAWLEAMDVDEIEEGGAVRETQQSEKEEMKKVPVLSVWMMRKKTPGWKEAFGEQEMVVQKAEG